MAVSYVNIASKYDTTSTTTLDINVPSGVQDGDFMIAHICTRYTTTATPSGRTLLGTKQLNSTTVNQYVYYRIANSEPASYSRTKGGSSGGMGEIIAYRGVYSTPINTYSDTSYVTSDTICRGGTITTDRDGCKLLFLGCQYYAVAGTFTAPSSLGTRDVKLNTGNTYADFYNIVCDITQSSLGTTGNIDATMGASLTNKGAFLIAIAPSEASTSTGNMFLMF